VTLQPTGPDSRLQTGLVLALLGSLAAHAGLLALAGSVPSGQPLPGSIARTLSLQITRPSPEAMTDASRQSEMKLITGLPASAAGDSTPPGHVPEQTGEAKPRPARVQRKVTGRTPLTHPQPSRVKKTVVQPFRKPQPATSRELAARSLKSQAKTLPKPKPRTATTNRGAETGIGSTVAAKTADPASKARNTAGEAAPKALTALLLQQLSRHFRYPGLARRRGIQGQVVLQLTVQRDGAIDAVEILDSSGHGILDRDAVKTLKRIGRIPLAGRLLLSQSMELTLPVIYRLKSE